MLGLLCIQTSQSLSHQQETGKHGRQSAMGLQVIKLKSLVNCISLADCHFHNHPPSICTGRSTNTQRFSWWMVTHQAKGAAPSTVIPTPPQLAAPGASTATEKGGPSCYNSLFSHEAWYWQVWSIQIKSGRNLTAISSSTFKFDFFCF